MNKTRRLIALLCSIMLLGIPAAFAEQGSDGFDTMAENSFLRLSMNKDTMQARVTVLSSGKEYTTMLFDDASGSPATQNIQKSALNVQFIQNMRRGTTGAMDSYSLSVAQKTAAVEPIPGGFSVRYQIGNSELNIEDLPKAVPVSKYNEKLLPFWTEKDIKVFRSNYRVVPRDDGSETWVRMNDDGLGKLVIKQIYGLLYEKGQYTKDDYTEDNAAWGYISTNENLKISITAQFIIDGDALIVSVPCDQIESAIQNPVTSFDLLPYFLRADDKTEGYFFIPDGSGALMRFNNQKLGIAAYQGKIYGDDVLIDPFRYRPEQSPIALPVYGMCTDDGGVLAVIEEGAALATLFADISGHNDRYNRIFSTFVLREVERVSMGDNKTITTPRFSQDVYHGKVSIRYRFLDAEKANYSSMALMYRQMLIERGMLSESAQPKDAPLFLEILGAVRKQKFIFGIPYESTVEATTLSQADIICKALMDEGVDALYVLFDGAFKDGIKHSSLEGFPLSLGIGSKNDLTKLRSTLNGMGGKLYLSANLGKVYNQKGMFIFSNAARRHDGEPADVYSAHEPTLYTVKEKSSAYISPEKLTPYVKRIADSMEGFDVDGINVKDLGHTLIGDYKRKGNLSPISAIPMFESALSALKQKPTAAYPNLYALPHISAITRLPEEHGGYKLLDESVPFLQLVYQGCLPFSGIPFNEMLYKDPQQLLLSAMETRTLPSFTLSYQSPTLFHNTNDLDFLSCFASEYSANIPFIKDIYERYGAFYHEVYGLKIIKHEIISDTLHKAYYENGLSVLFNYAQTAVNTDGITVPSMGYALKRGE